MRRIITIFAMATMGLMATVSPMTVLAHQTTTHHLKKDGTPDKRFKENNQHLRKDGKPDMRNKSNNPNAGKKKKS